jgi:hypothetical protein
VTGAMSAFGAMLLTKNWRATQVTQIGLDATAQPIGKLSYLAGAYVILITSLPIGSVAKPERRLAPNRLPGAEVKRQARPTTLQS